MFTISEKYSGKDKKEAIENFKKNDQGYRKKLHPISRDLYRYFNQKLHIGYWNLNGLYKRNKYYYYIGPSLGFIDKEGNKRYDKSEQNKGKININKGKIKSFPEYDFIEENQYEIIIEYCSNCEEHQTHTFHNSETYHNYAIYLQKCILLRYPFIKVLLKPIDTNDIKIKLPKISNGNNLEKKFNIRIGAFEVILCYKIKGSDTKKELLYSKLDKKKFPSILNILDKILYFVPTFNGEITVYEKEDDKNLIKEAQKENEIYGKKDLIEGLEINIYRLNNQEIINLANKAMEEIQVQQNPKKRLIIIKEQKLLDKIKLETKFTYESNRYRYKKKRIRPQSSMTIIQSSDKEQEKENRLTKSQSTLTLLRQNSVKSEMDNNLYVSEKFQKEFGISANDFYIKDNINKSTKSKYIFDKKKSESLKGRFMLRKYTNEDGMIKIGPLPYDSYYIEVKESKQFRNVGICLSFQNLNLYKNNYIKKYIGLFTQENSFIQIQVYEINSKEPIHLSNSKVTLKKIEGKNNDPNNQHDKNLNHEINLEIKESNKSGIFEHTVPPGDYILQVEKPNYEKTKKLVSLKRGLNTINIEMSIERYFNLQIIVYDYENFSSPIHNADIVIYKNSDEILEESITNKKGEFNYIVDKGIDFLTIVVDKMDFFPAQRIFERNIEAKVNEKGEYEEKIVFYLVRKKYVVNNDLVVIMTYCNLFGNNFDVSSIQISNEIKEKLNIVNNDEQKKYGFISTCIKYENTKNTDESDESSENIEDVEKFDNYDKIINVSYHILSSKLKTKTLEEDNSSINGLEKYACQTIIYTPKNIFYIPSPSLPIDNYSIWFIGWLDIKNKLFYETNILLQNLEQRISYFNEWLEFLQILIDEQMYSNLFENFCFEKGHLELGDRTLDQSVFEEKIKSLEYFNGKESLKIDFICSLFKNKNNRISFSRFKQIISSNLKNFVGNNISENY